MSLQFKTIASENTHKSGKALSYYLQKVLSQFDRAPGGRLFNDNNPIPQRSELKKWSTNEAASYLTCHQQANDRTLIFSPMLLFKEVENGRRVAELNPRRSVVSGQIWQCKVYVLIDSKTQKGLFLHAQNGYLETHFCQKTFGNESQYPGLFFPGQYFDTVLYYGNLSKLGDKRVGSKSRLDDLCLSQLSKLLQWRFEHGYSQENQCLSSLTVKAYHGTSPNVIVQFCQADHDFKLYQLPPDHCFTTQFGFRRHKQSVECRSATGLDIK